MTNPLCVLSLCLESLGKILPSRLFWLLKQVSLVALMCFHGETLFPNSVYNCHNPRGICLITRLRLGLSHLREHKFKHGFQDMLNPLCSCGNDVESTEHFLLHCPQFVNERRTLLSILGNFNYSLLENTSKVLTQTLLFENTSLSLSDNSQVLSSTIDFILSTKRFNEQLF